jgi:hypothetical protein
MSFNRNRTELENLIIGNQRGEGEVEWADEDWEGGQQVSLT